MRYIRLASPDLVVADLGGTQAALLRHALGATVRDVADDYLPEAWSDLPLLTVYRDPIARFYALLFEENRAARADPWLGQAPPPPHRAVDLIGRDDRALARRLAPQTHPRHSPFRQGHTLRHERLAQDLAALAPRLGLSPRPLPRLAEPATPAPGALTDRLRRAYDADLRLLGYDAQGCPTGPILPTPRGGRSPAALWPGYLGGEAGAPVLPDPDQDFTPLLDQRVAASYAPNTATARPDMRAHLAELEPEMGGRSLLAFLLVATIPALRRNPRDPRASALFHRLTVEHGTRLSSELDLRWLISVCDSFADIGRSDTDRAVGLLGSATGNLIKLAETERRMFHPRRPWPPRHRVRAGGRLFAGAIQFWPYHGDMIDNLMSRFERGLPETSPASPFATMILILLNDCDCVLSRMRLLGDQPAAPVMDAALRDRIEAMTADL